MNKSLVAIIAALIAAATTFSSAAEAGLKSELEKLGFGIVAFACTTCNGMSGALTPAIQQEIVERDLYAVAVLSGNRNFDGRIHPYALIRCLHYT